MGTRHLIKVKKNGVYKIAQYGQWDGYLSGQGQSILIFLQDKELVEKLKNKLSIVRFIDEVKDKQFIEEYNKNAPNWSNEPDNRTKEQIYWAKTYISRDIGSDILINVAQSKDKEILLQNNLNFEEDDLFCEYVYLIDFDENIFEIFAGKNKLGSFKLDNLPKLEDFLKLESDEIK